MRKQLEKERNVARRARIASAVWRCLALGGFFLLLSLSFRPFSPRLAPHSANILATAPRLSEERLKQFEKICALELIYEGLDAAERVLAADTAVQKTDK